MRPIRLEIEGLQSFKERQVIDFEKLTEYGLFGIFGKTGSGKSTILDGMILALFDEIPRNKIDGNKSSLLNSINDSSKKMEVYYSFALGDDIYEIKRNYKRGVSKGQEVINSKDAILIKNGNILANKKTEVKNILNEEFGLDVEDFSRTVVLPQGKFNEFLKLRGKEKIEMLEKIFALEKYGEKLEKKIFSEKRHWYTENEKYRNQIIGKGEIKLEDINKIENSLEEEKEKLFNKEKEKKEFDKTYEEEKKLRDLLDDNIKLNVSKEETLKKKDLIEKYKSEINKNDLGKKFKIQMDDLLLLKEKLKEIIEEKNKLEKSKIKEDESIKSLEKINKNLLSKKELYIKEKIDINFDIEELRKVNELCVEKNNLLIEKNQKYKLEENIAVKEKEKLKNKIKSETNKKILKEKQYEIQLIGEIDKSILKETEEKIKEKVEYINRAKEEKKSEELKKDLIEELKKEREVIIKDKKIYLEQIKEKNKKLKQSFADKLYAELKDGEPCPVCGSIHHKQMNVYNEDSNKLEKEIENLSKEKDQKIGDEGKLSEKINKLGEELNNFKDKFQVFDIQREETNIKKQLEKLEIDKIEIENKEKRISELKTIVIQNKAEENSLLKDKERLTEELTNLKNDYLKLEKEIEKKELEILRKYGEISKETLEILNKRKKQLEKHQDEIYNLQNKTEALDIEISNNCNVLQGNILNSDKINTSIIKKETESSLIIDDIHIKTTKFEELLSKSIFKNEDEIKKSILNDENYEKIKSEINNYEEKVQRIKTLLEENIKLIAGRNQSLERWEKLKNKNKDLKEINEILKIKISALEKDIQEKTNLLKDLKEIMRLKNNAEKKYEVAEELGKKLKGRAFVEFLSVKKLKSIVYQASQRLKRITNGRYQLISDEECDFYVIDYFNEGSKRRCSTLSGGETFIVSLCLALALSNQMQLKGKVQLEFFFLDEGFGTLDEKLLDKVIESLENINSEEKLKVGIITHLEELKVRIIRSLEVSAAIPGIKGSCVKII